MTDLSQDRPRRTATGPSASVMEEALIVFSFVLVALVVLGVFTHGVR